MGRTASKKNKGAVGASGAWSRNVDSKGRLTLGDSFANRTVIVEEQGDGEILVRLAKVIPQSEAWLYENPAALAAVRTGLDQAKKGKRVKGPDMAKARRIAGQIADDEG